MTQRAILIVGEDEGVCDTFAAMLGEWETTTTDPAGAALAILGRVYDLLILCEAVEENDAREIVSQAKSLNSDLKFFAISHSGKKQQLGVPTFEARTFPLANLRDAVAGLMGTDARRPTSTGFAPTASFEAVYRSARFQGAGEVLSPLGCRRTGFRPGPGQRIEEKRAS
jgi:hypothetical protein